MTGRMCRLTADMPCRFSYDRVRSLVRQLIEAIIEHDARYYNPTQVAEAAEERINSCSRSNIIVW